MDNPLLRRITAGFLLAKALYDLSEERKAARAGKSPRRRRSRAAREGELGSDALAPIVTRRLFGLWVADLTLAETVQRIIAWAGETPARAVLFTDLDKMMLGRRDEPFARVTREADLLVAEGGAFHRLADNERQPLQERVAPIDLIAPLARAAAKRRRSVFLFGSTMMRLNEAARRLKRDNPSLDVRGAYAPPDGFEHDPALHADLLRMFRTTRPDIVLVALPSPTQELFASAMADAVRHGVFVAVGDAIDEFVGPLVVRRPPFHSAFGRLSALPSLYAEHRRDRRATAAARRRAALAVLSDQRYRAARAQARGEDRERTVSAMIDEDETLAARRRGSAEGEDDRVAAGPQQRAAASAAGGDAQAGTRAGEGRRGNGGGRDG